MTAGAHCPSCGAEVGAGDAYCEACGQDLAAPVRSAQPSTVPGPEEAPGRWLTSAVTTGACPGCGGDQFGPEGYCEVCGQRRADTLEHTELDLGTFAAVTDRGLRHHRNEDAVGLAELAHAAVAVVCDGVSSSTRPDAASTGAVVAATTALRDNLARGESTVEAIGAATRAAQAAATLAAGAEPGSNPPASTFVCAVVAGGSVTVGWVGDSRAYWLPDSDAGIPADGTGDNSALCLTEDDTVAGRALREGATLPASMPDGQADSLVRWLGADATDTRPHLRAFSPTGPGRVLVCSDGLYKYRPDAEELAALTPRDQPLAAARALVRFALDSGGADNITVALLQFPQPAEGASGSGSPRRGMSRDELPPRPYGHIDSEENDRHE